MYRITFAMNWVGEVATTLSRRCGDITPVPPPSRLCDGERTDDSRRGDLTPSARRDGPPSRDLTEFDRLMLDLELERLSLTSVFICLGTELRRYKFEIKLPYLNFKGLEHI